VSDALECGSCYGPLMQVESDIATDTSPLIYRCMECGQWWQRIYCVNTGATRILAVCYDMTNIRDIRRTLEGLP
jgi:uncharacterized Zn finger protein